MTFKRTGWEMVPRLTFNEVLPLDDLKEHGLGDECWCNPVVEHVDGVPPGEVDVLISHNSADKREYNEPDSKHRKPKGL